MRGSWWLVRIVTVVVFVGVLWSGQSAVRGPVAARAASYNSVTINGDCTKFANDEKLNGNDSTQTWITWDATNVYVGWLGGGGNSQKRIIAFDLDPGANDGSSLNYSGVVFPSQGQPDYVAEVSSNTTYFATRTGGTLSTATNPSGAANWFSSCGNTNFTELQLPRSLFSGGSVSGLSPSNGMGVYSYFEDPSGGNNNAGYVYGGMPQGKIGSGSINQSASDEFYFPTTDAGRSPATYGRLLFTVGGNIQWNGLFGDQSPFYFASSATSTTTTEPVQNGGLIVRFRSAHSNLTSLNINWSDCATDCGGYSNWIPMNVVGQDATGTYDIWQADASSLLSSSSTKFYRFQANDGNSTTWYNANGPTCGTGGQTSCQAPGSSNFWVIPGFHTPGWSKSAIFYQIFPDRFRNGDPSNDISFHSSTPVTADGSGNCPTGSYNYDGFCAFTHTAWNEGPTTPAHAVDFFGGDLAGITQEINPYLKQTLGVNALYLNPIFQSPSNHKYDTQDYLTVDPHFGTNTGSGAGSFTSLIGTAHSTSNFSGDARMSVMLDGVFNHTGDWNCWFNVPGNTCNGVAGAYQSQSSPYLNWYEFQNNWPSAYCAWSGFGNLPQLNYSSSGVRDEIYRGSSSIMRTYLSPPYNADGWRLDVADNYSDMGSGIGGACSIGTDNHPIWQEARSYLKGNNAASAGGSLAEDLILGEYWQKPTAWLGGNEWDSVMNYNGFNTPVSCFFNGQGVHGETDSATCGTANTPSGLSAWLQGTLADNNRSSQLVMLNSLTTHDTSRFLYRACISVDSTTSDCASSATIPQAAYNKLKMAIEMQMTYVGMPSIYYGDEIGTTGANDPDNRRTFDWSPADWKTSVLDLTRTLTHNRTAHAAWQDGSFMPLVKDDTKNVFVYGRLALDPTSIGSAGGVTPSDAAVVALNNSGSQQTVTVDATQLDLVDGTTLTDLAGGGTATVSGGTITLTLPAYTGMVLTPTPTSVPALAAPNAPTNLAASPVAGGATTLTWNAPASGAPVIGYDVTATPGGTVGPVSCTGTDATSCSATVSGLASTTSYTLTVKANNEAGDGTAATLDTPAAPAITSQPSDTAVTEGKSLSLSVVASGTPTLTYQWYFSSSGANRSFSAVNGATGSTYSVQSVATSDAGYYYVIVTNATDSATSNTAYVTVSSKPTPTITWGDPSAITYGMALGNTQLNATASVPGTFAYMPVSGTMLNAGQSQALSVTFTPSDTSNYSTAMATVHIAVNPKTLTVTANSPSMTFGDSTIPPVTCTPSGFVTGDSFVTLPTAQVLSHGSPITVNSSTPAGVYTTHCAGADAGSNYTINAMDGTFTIRKATPTLAWSNPADITYGAALSRTQLNATATLNGSPVGGTFTYTPAAGTVLNAGNNQALQTSFFPSDSIDYTAPQPITAHINVLKAPLSVTTDAKSVQYSDPLPAFTVSYSTFVNGDTNSVLGGALACTTTAVTNTGKQVLSGVGSYPITCSGQTSSNYTIAYHSGTLMVTAEDTVVRPAQTNPIAVQVSRAGGTAPALTVTAQVTEVADGSYGDISKASPITVTLRPLVSGATQTCTIPGRGGAVTRTVAATRTTPGSITVRCSFGAGGAPGVYDVTFSVGGNFYRGLAGAALTVYDPSQMGVQWGGGLVTNPNTHNTVSFGFMASLKSGGSVAGTLFSVESDANGNEVTVLRGSAMSGLTVVKSGAAVYPQTATITGTAIMNGAANYGYTLQASDAAGTAKDADRYGMHLTDSTGATVTGQSYAPQLLLSGSSGQLGNIYVKK